MIANDPYCDVTWQMSGWACEPSIIILHAKLGTNMNICSQFHVFHFLQQAFMYIPGYTKNSLQQGSSSISQTQSTFSRILVCRAEQIKLSADKCKPVAYNTSQSQSQSHVLTYVCYVDYLIHFWTYSSYLFHPPISPPVFPHFLPLNKKLSNFVLGPISLMSLDLSVFYLERSRQGLSKIPTDKVLLCIRSKHKLFQKVSRRCILPIH